MDALKYAAPIVAATAAATVAVMEYARLAVNGQVFPFAPVALHKDPDGTYNKGKYSTPTLKIDWYLPANVDLRQRARDEKEYLQRRAKWHFQDKNHVTPLQLQVWPTAVAYCMDYWTDASIHARLCLHVMGWYGGTNNTYVESVVANKLSE